MGDRVILHCDLNCFFASVELLSHPDLRDIPTAVCGDPASRHGIILAKNEPAKKYGIQTAETVWQAKKKCPGLVLLPPHHDLYKMWSVRVNDIYERFTDLIEPFGIDESWLDVTGSLHLFGGDAEKLADKIRKTVKNETGLTISVGVSFNKVFAKLGSDMKKPDATTVIPIDGWQNIVWPQPLGNLLYAGRAATQTLKKYGVETIGQLAACDPAMPEQLLGKMGRQLWEYANGLDKSPVKPRHAADPVKSVGNGTTFPDDLVRWEQICAGLMPLCDSVAARLRQNPSGPGGDCLGHSHALRPGGRPPAPPRPVCRRRQRDAERRIVQNIQPPDPLGRAYPSGPGYLPCGCGPGPAAVEAACPPSLHDRNGAVRHRDVQHFPTVGSAGQYRSGLRSAAGAAGGGRGRYPPKIWQDGHCLRGG